MYNLGLDRLLLCIQGTEIQPMKSVEILKVFCNMVYLNSPKFQKAIEASYEKDAE